ncbi:Ig-like domain-containing protein [Cellulophaga baltica]|uniref:Ig-like domain-containing protein n=1 Tax=Cellulophaga baltica TaxID=76594 RepID=UPI0015F6841A|nr:Ig-like domain-containing protein [Cellulophaga baltica]MBA6314707.1 hypothetical protein [Cellulophaga baltica]
MKIPHFTKCLGSLLTFALLTFSCSQDTETTFAELIVEETVATETITPEEEVTEEAAEPIIDYQKGTLVLSEDTKVALDITKGAEENSTSKKTYSLKSITQPKNGKTEMNNNNEIVYSPAADYNGDDSFSYTLNIQDSTETTVEQVNTFNITITPTKDVVDDLVTTTYETAKTIAPLTNDTFAASSSVSITEISLANKGIAVLNSDNTITYTPNKATSGEDQIQYKTSITNSDASVSTENGTLKVTILNNVQPTGANIKYVTTTGKSTNTGATEASAWSISHAFNTAKAGDIVYIKAGNYGAVNLVVKNSGNASNPIQFIGYKTNPGDIESINGPTVSYQDYKNNGNKLDATVMPTIIGNTINDEGQGTGIKSTKSYIQFSNFQISNYEKNIFAEEGTQILIKNIISTDAGDFNIDHMYVPKSEWKAGDPGTTTAGLEYSGWGVVLYGTNSQIENSIVINAGAEGFHIRGDNHKHNNNKVYSDSKINPCDYYYLITDANYNTLDNIYVERVGDLAHAGHGLVLKVRATNNNINNCKSKNTAIETSFDGVNNNNFYNCHITGGIDKNGAFLIANGSHHNTYTNCSTDDAEGVQFSDWKDGLESGTGLTNAGHDNKFINCVFKNQKSAINLYWWDQSAFIQSAAYSNTFENCEFKNLDYLFEVDRINYNNSVKNSTITNVKELRYSQNKSNVSLSLGFTFTNVSIIDSNIKLP